MLHAARSELLDTFATGDCRGVKTISFNKGLKAFVDNRSINRCSSEQAGMFSLLFCKQHPSAEGTAERGQACPYAPYNTTCRSGRAGGRGSAPAHPCPQSRPLQGSSPASLLNPERFKVGQMLSPAKFKAIAKQNGAHQCSASSSSSTCQSSEGLCELNGF